ncbi:unnamed protein product, partial [Meganyctiphanes norvegica]
IDVVAVNMIRRSSGRTPPFVLIGLIFIVLILAYNYWTLSSQNSDLQEDIERLQTEIKINAVKQEQSEKKNAALQDQVHDMDELSSKLRKQVLEEEDSLKKSDNFNKKKDYEITKLKSEMGNLEERLPTVPDNIDEYYIYINSKKLEIESFRRHITLIILKTCEKSTPISYNQANLKFEQASLRSCNTDVKELKLVNDRLADKLIEANQQVEQEYLPNIELQKKQLAANEAQIISLRNEINSKNSQLVDRTSDIKELETNLQKEQSLSGTLQASLDSINQKLTQTFTDLTECHDNVAQLHDTAKLHEAKLAKAQDELAALRREQIAAAAAQLPQAAMNMIPNVQYKDVNNAIEKRDVPLEKENDVEIKKNVNAYDPVDTAQRNDQLAQPNIPG